MLLASCKFLCSRLAYFAPQIIAIIYLKQFYLSFFWILPHYFIVMRFFGSKYYWYLWCIFFTLIFILVKIDVNNYRSGVSEMGKRGSGEWSVHFPYSFFSSSLSTAYEEPRDTPLNLLPQVLPGRSGPGKTIPGPLLRYVLWYVATIPSSFARLIRASFRAMSWSSWWDLLSSASRDL
jgi:hypothetical protein